MPAKPTFPNPAATLPGEADILASVVANLADDTAKLVYADWLEERDDPRGPFLRSFLKAFQAGKKPPVRGAGAKPWQDLVGLTLLDKLRKTKLSDRAETFLRLARPALTFEAAKYAGTPLPVGSSKFGGEPDLPPGSRWPKAEGESLAFLGQINLAELRASPVARELPEAGLLSVFCAATADDTSEPSGEGDWRLFYFPNTPSLRRRPLPEDLETEFPTCCIWFTETLDLPDIDSPWNQELGFGQGAAIDDEYEHLLDNSRFGHKLLGYPVPIQGDVLYKKTRRHLLTIDSEDDNGPDWMWGDGGSLYFTIDEADLQAGRFDRVHFEMNCA